MERDPYRVLRPLIEGAAALGLAQLLDALPFYTLPYGGEVSLAMTPLLVFALRWGAGPGALLGTVYALWNLLLRWDWAPPWTALVLDRVLAFTVLGVAGLFRGRKYGAFGGTALGVALRCACHVYSGLHFRTDPIPARFLNLTMSAPDRFYPLYDTLWMCLNLVPCLATMWVLWILLRRYLTAEDLLERGE